MNYSAPSNSKQLFAFTLCALEDHIVSNGLNALPPSRKLDEALALEQRSHCHQVNFVHFHYDDTGWTFLQPRESPRIAISSDPSMSNLATRTLPILERSSSRVVALTVTCWTPALDAGAIPPEPVCYVSTVLQRCLDRNEIGKAVDPAIGHGLLKVGGHGLDPYHPAALAKVSDGDADGADVHANVEDVAAVSLLVTKDPLRNGSLVEVPSFQIYLGRIVIFTVARHGKGLASERDLVPRVRRADILWGWFERMCKINMVWSAADGRRIQRRQWGVQRQIAMAVSRRQHGSGVTGQDDADRQQQRRQEQEEEGSRPPPGRGVQAGEGGKAELTNAANQAIQMAVNNGNDETVRHLHSRLIQATHEVRNMLKQITGVAPITLDEAPPLKSTNEQAGSDDSGDDVPSSSLLIPNPSVQAKNKKAIVADNSKNNSRLCVGGQGQGKKGRKSRRKTKEVAATIHGGQCAMDIPSKQSGSVASGSIRQNPLQAMLLARDGSQGRAAGTCGNPIQAQVHDSMNANENDGVGDFNLGIPHTATGDSGRGGSGRSHCNLIQVQLMAREGNQGFARSAVAVVLAQFDCCLKADSTCFKADSTRFGDGSWPSWRGNLPWDERRGRHGNGGRMGAGVDATHSPIALADTRTVAAADSLSAPCRVRLLWRTGPRLSSGLRTPDSQPRPPGLAAPIANPTAAPRRTATADDDAGPASKDDAGPAGGVLRRVAAARRAVPGLNFPMQIRWSPSRESHPLRRANAAPWSANDDDGRATASSGAAPSGPWPNRGGRR
ncbi:hypothetical protein THAOC_34821 [Thalassiosira oceanica]|uniref:Uncharacterized protein n=1 Tax=Thalassiosira oceanica TaxID=159749 RepID=K0R1W5_THAOC|nr:hypothetical protein THAOC_34821 [Thalassiosira oceanica]|eukprot:EJK46508.1 hypothetical protein THAOC_34821 [Thalassiosira oceanica]